MANETGNPDFKYELACTEICGRGHFAMRFIVVVDEPEDFEAWLADQTPFVEQNPQVLAKVATKASKELVAEAHSEEKAEIVKTEL